MTSDDLDSASGEPGRLRAEVARLTAELTQSQQREATLQDQLTGTASLLRVIASGPADVGPVLTAIAESAMQHSDSKAALLLVRDGEYLVKIRLQTNNYGYVRGLADPQEPKLTPRDLWPAAAVTEIGALLPNPTLLCAGSAGDRGGI